MKSVNTPTGRYYEVSDGVKYPSVTTVLGCMPNPGLDAWRKRVGEAEAKKIGRRAAQRGTAVHEELEYFLNKEESGKKLMPNVANIVGAIKEELTRHLTDMVVQEKALFSHALEMAGRVDCIASWDGVLSVVDFKTSNNPKEEWMIDSYFAQCACYAIMWEEMTGEKIDNLVVVIGVEGGICQTYTSTTFKWCEFIQEKRLYFKSKNQS